MSIVLANVDKIVNSSGDELVVADAVTSVSSGGGVSVEMVAAGPISKDDGVILNHDGTVSKVTSNVTIVNEALSAITTDSTAQNGSGSTSLYNRGACRLDNNRFVTILTDNSVTDKNMYAAIVDYSSGTPVFSRVQAITALNGELTENHIVSVAAVSPNCFYVFQLKGQGHYTGFAYKFDVDSSYTSITHDGTRYGLGSNPTNSPGSNDNYSLAYIEGSQLLVLGKMSDGGGLYANLNSIKLDPSNGYIPKSGSTLQKAQWSQGYQNLQIKDYGDSEVLKMCVIQRNDTTYNLIGMEWSKYSGENISDNSNMTVFPYRGIYPTFAVNKNEKEGLLSFSDYDNGYSLNLIFFSAVKNIFALNHFVLEGRWSNDSPANSKFIYNESSDRYFLHANKYNETSLVWEYKILSIKASASKIEVDEIFSGDNTYGQTKLVDMGSFIARMHGNGPHGLGSITPYSENGVTDVEDFIGIAGSSVSSGSLVNVTLRGGVHEYTSGGFMPNSEYYLNHDGTFGSFRTNHQISAKSLTSNKLKLG